MTGARGVDNPSLTKEFRSISGLGRLRSRRDQDALVRMKPLSAPDTHHLNAAIGWLGLGNYIEANEELDRIAPAVRAHPDVLIIRWAVYANAKRWDACLDIARMITAKAPENAIGWINLSVSLYRIGKTESAYQSLSSVRSKFAGNWTVNYDLACYAAQLGSLDEAEKLLHEAMDVGDANEVRRLILDDPDLEPVRSRFSLGTA